MKMFERLQAKKKDNKGFSLVELIIVIAIMAILVGVVGTQVVPYLNKSKVAKDQQLLSAFATAAVSAYSYQADKITSSGAIVINDYFTAETDSEKKAIQDEMATLVGYAATSAGKTSLQSKMSSAYGKSFGTLKITLDQSTHTVLVELLGGTGTPVVPDAEATL